ncbi:MAG: YciI family protein [Nocardioidaceae bacterium]
MKYLMLIYSNPEPWGHPSYLGIPETQAMGQSERDTMLAEGEAWLDEIRQTGELVSAEALAAPLTARTVRVRDNATLVTDGPYVEAKEQMAGVFVLDCATPERAEELASRVPDARFSAVELRPIMGSAGQEM